MLPFRKNILGLPASVHGGVTIREIIESGSPYKKNVIDFSTNTNPFGPPAGTRHVLTKAHISSYPDSESTELRQGLAQNLGIHTDNLLIGSGSTELIRLIVTAVLDDGNRVIIPRPTYGEYETASKIVNARIINADALKSKNFALQSENIIDLCKKNKPRLIFLCNPNNPTGQYFQKSEIERILSASSNAILVLDEAYIAFTEHIWSSIDLLSHNNLIIMRSMTKDYSLAGLRLGYAISNSTVISILKRLLPPWNVSSTAQVAGLHVIKDGSFLTRSNSRIKRSKDLLIKSLIRLGFNIIPSQTNFFLVWVGKASVFKAKLLKQGILVRDCTSFGLPEYIRVSPRSISNCKKLINAMAEIKSES